MKKCLLFLILTLGTSFASAAPGDYCSSCHWYFEYPYCISDGNWCCEDSDCFTTLGPWPECEERPSNCGARAYCRKNPCQ